MRPNYHARDPHPLAGKTVTLKSNSELDGHTYTVEDYWQNVSGISWMFAEGNPAAMNYGLRSGLAGLPIDNEVVYGKVGALGHIVHVSELGQEVVNG